MREGYDVFESIGICLWWMFQTCLFIRDCPSIVGLAAQHPLVHCLPTSSTSHPLFILFPLPTPSYHAHMATYHHPMKIRMQAKARVSVQATSHRHSRCTNLVQLGVRWYSLVQLGVTWRTWCNLVQFTPTPPTWYKLMHQLWGRFPNWKLVVLPVLENRTSRNGHLRKTECWVRPHGLLMGRPRNSSWTDKE